MIFEFLLVVFLGNFSTIDSVANTQAFKSNDSIIIKKDSVNKKTDISLKQKEMMEKMMNIGQVYGKVIDSVSKQGLESVSIQIYKETFMPNEKRRLVGGALTAKNGEFLIENLPTMGKFTMIIMPLGAESKSLSFSFIDPKEKKEDKGGAPDMMKQLSKFAKDLGDITLSIMDNTPTEQKGNLEEVVVSGKAKSNINKQVFDVSKNLVSGGATAQEVLRNVPNVNVSVEGEVTVRNSTPQIFVNGLPTNLSLDEIPANDIERVEVITNPSAKFDAGGQGGILNIVLKKSKTLGFNGNLMLGSFLYMPKINDYIGDLYHGNMGVTMNFRKDKVNFFISSMLMQRRTQGFSILDRKNLNTTNETTSSVYQESTNMGRGNVFMNRLGLDYFINNRNTLTLSGNFGMGAFNPFNNLLGHNKIYSTAMDNYYGRRTDGEVNFKNYAGQATYKLMFPQDEHELVIDVMFNKRSFSNESGIIMNTYTANDFATKTTPTQYQLNALSSSVDKFTQQIDYTYPILKNLKLETGARINIEKIYSKNIFSNTDANKNIIKQLNFLEYDYSEYNYALYGSMVYDKNNFVYQAGLRLEHVNYGGKTSNDNQEYRYILPINLFPTLAISYKFNDHSLWQLSYSRKIKKPNIFNLIPFIDYTDSANLVKGNPNLQPEFTDIFELSNIYNFSNKHSLTSAIYTKYTTDMINPYQEKTSLNNALGGFLTTYINSATSLNSGVDFALQNTWGDLQSVFNTNVFYSYLNTNLPNNNISFSQWTFFIKENISYKLPKGFSVQLFFEYKSKSIIPPDKSSSQNMPGRPNYLNTPTSASQGYIEPMYAFDLGIKKEFLKGLINVTLVGSDIFKTRLYSGYSNVNGLFNQHDSRVRDQMLFRLNIMMRFGKMDVSLFKRKNTKTDKEQTQQGEGF